MHSSALAERKTIRLLARPEHDSGVTGCRISSGGTNPAGMESEQSEKKPKKKRNSGFLTLNPGISNIPQETQIL